MSSAEKKTIDLKTALKDVAMESSPSFPDFAQVYRKAEQRPRKVRRYVFSAAIMAAAAMASFWIGIAWHNRSSRDVALIDSWSSTSISSPAATVSTANGQQTQVVLASSRNSTVSLFVQDLWESSSSGGL